MGFDVTQTLETWTRRGLSDEGITREDALRVLTDERIEVLPLVHAAGAVRRRFFGKRVQIHQLHNVQNGACPEDCGYCGQNRDSKAPIEPYRLKPKEEIIAEAQRAKEAGAYRYCMVLSGRGPSDADIDHMVECIREVKTRFELKTCLSAGLMDEGLAKRLAAAGLDQLNHNLNTSREHYPEICSTHTYGDRIATLRAARSAGLKLCSGLIVGMGEGYEDVVDVAMELRGLKADSLPVNFLVPIPGNQVVDARLAGKALTPEMCLRVLCMFRLTNPSAEIRIGAGREGHLRSQQALALHPANSLFVDGYLLTRGSSTMETIRMIVDAGMDLVMDGEAPKELTELIEVMKSGGTEAFHVDGSGQVIKEERLSARKLARLSINGEEAVGYRAGS